MVFSSSSHDPQTVNLMTRAFNAAVREVEARNNLDPASDEKALHHAMVARLIGAANLGERDPEKLKIVALRALRVVP